MLEMLECALMLVRSTKRCLKKSLRCRRLNYEEMSTLLAEVEAVLNSRPLTYVYEDDVQQPLTPSHLFTGRRTITANEIIEDDDEICDLTRDGAIDRLNAVDMVLSHFWKRWVKEYLLNLRECHKMNQRPEVHIKEGDVVLVQDDNVKRNKWKLAVVDRLIKGDDQRTRGAWVRLAKKGKQMTKMKRPIQKLYPLELNEKTDHHRDGLKESTAEEAKTEDDTAHDDAPYPEDLRKYSSTGEDAGRLNDNYKTDNLSTYDDETDDIIDDETRRVRCVPRRAAALDSDVRRKLISETFE